MSFLRSISSFSAIFIHPVGLKLLLLTKWVLGDHQIRVLLMRPSLALQICTQELLLNLTYIVIAVWILYFFEILGRSDLLLSRIEAPKGMLALADLAVLPGITLLVQVDEHIWLARVAVNAIRGWVLSTYSWIWDPRLVELPLTWFGSIYDLSLSYISMTSASGDEGLNLLGFSAPFPAPLPYKVD